MKIDLTTVIGAALIFALAYKLGQRRAGSPATTPAADLPVGWSFAGSWGGGL